MSNCQTGSSGLLGRSGYVACTICIDNYSSSESE